MKAKIIMFAKIFFLTNAILVGTGYSEIQLNIETDKSSYYQGKEIAITVTLTNNTSRKIGIPKTFFENAERYFYLVIDGKDEDTWVVVEDVTSEVKKKVTKIYFRALTLGEFWPTDPLKLEPKGTTTFKYLNPADRSLGLGKHKIEIVFPYGIQIRYMDDAGRKVEFYKIDKIKSPSVDIEIIDKER